MQWYVSQLTEYLAHFIIKVIVGDPQVAIGNDAHKSHLALGFVLHAVLLAPQDGNVFTCCEFIHDRGISCPLTRVSNCHASQLSRELT